MTSSRCTNCSGVTEGEMKWAGVGGNLKGRGHWEVLGLVGKIILNWMLNELNERGWSGLIWLS